MWGKEVKKTSRVELVCCPIWARSRICVLGVIPAAIGFYLFFSFFSLSGYYFIFPDYVDGTHAGERASDKVLIPHLAYSHFSALAKTFLESLAQSV